MTAPVRWGILGVAGINAATVPALLASENSELIGIASRSLARAEAAAAEVGVEAFDGYEALLADPRIEAVYIPTPNAEHARWAIRAAEAGKHVLCEKPLAVTADEVRAMAAAATASDVRLAEAFMYAHHPRYTALRELIAAGEIGELRQLHIAFTFDASDEVDHSGFQGAPGSGAVYDVGCYGVHVSRMLLGAEPEAVTAHAAVSEAFGGIDMSTTMLLEFPGGVGATVQVGMWSADLDTVTVIGSRGRVEVPHAFICGPDDGDMLVTVGESTRTLVADRVDHYERQATRFSAAVRGETELLFDTDDAVRQAEVIDALSASWRTRTRVTLGAH